MKKVLVLLFIGLLALGACGGNTEVATEEVDEPKKRTEMLEASVMLYLTKMTNNFSSAFTVATTKDEKNEYLNKAITDINITVHEIEDEYEDGVPPTEDFFELAEVLKLTIEAEMLGDQQVTSKYSQEAGRIIGEISREYLDGELPTAFKLMTGLDSAN